MSKRENLFIGIDPGVTGAVVIITNGTAHFWNCPRHITSMQLIIQKIHQKYNKTHNMFAYLENVHTIETWSRQNGDKLMTNFGQWQGILASYSIPTALVLPKTWQRYTVDKQYGKGTKDNSKSTAKKSNYWCYEGWFSEYASSADVLIGSNHNRSDAFLIACFCERTKGGLC
jgi:hypothetical protein